MGPRAQESDAQAAGQVSHQGRRVGAVFLKIVPIAVVMGFKVTLSWRPQLSKANRLEGRCHLEVYGLICKHPQHLFSAVMEWRRILIIQNFIFRSWCNSKVVSPVNVALSTFRW